MIKHLLKLVWNRKRANALIVAEIFISFLVLFAVFTGAVTLISNWRRPIGFQWQNVWVVSMDYDIDALETVMLIKQAKDKGLNLGAAIEAARSFRERQGQNGSAQLEKALS